MSNKKTGYHHLFAKYFILCRIFSTAQDRGDHQTMKDCAERMEGHSFDGLTDTSRKKALEIFGLGLYDLEEAIYRKDTEETLHEEREEPLNLGDSHDAVERMFSNHAA